MTGFESGKIKKQVLNNIVTTSNQHFLINSPRETPQTMHPNKIIESKL